jgi:hypothetical protein
MCRPYVALFSIYLSNCKQWRWQRRQWQQWLHRRQQRLQQWQSKQEG